MDPKWLIFLAVARIGQVTEAGRRLNLSPSSVSAHIAALERDVGARLFVRSSRGVSLTPSGEILLAAAEQMESVWMRSKREVRAEHEGHARVRLASSHTAAELFLPRPLGRFRMQHPETRIQLIMTNSQHVIESVQDGTVDMGIVEGIPVGGRLHHEPLWTDELTLMVSILHPFAGRNTVSLSELSDLEWILREEGSGTRRVFEEALERAGLSVHELDVMMQLSSLRSIIAMVANNVGVSVLSRTILEENEIAVAGVVPITIEGLNLIRSLQVVLPTAKRSAATEELADQLREDVDIRRSHDVWHIRGGK